MKAFDVRKQNTYLPEKHNKKMSESANFPCIAVRQGIFRLKKIYSFAKERKKTVSFFFILSSFSAPFL
jgi:hypothetical protein